MNRGALAYRGPRPHQASSTLGSLTAPGKYFGYPNLDTGTTTPALSLLTLLQFGIPEDMALDQVAIAIATGAGVGNATHHGLWEMGPTGKPGRALHLGAPVTTPTAATTMEIGFSPVQVRAGAVIFSGLLFRGGTAPVCIRNLGAGTATMATSNQRLNGSGNAQFYTVAWANDWLPSDLTGLISEIADTNLVNQVPARVLRRCA